MRMCACVCVKQKKPGKRRKQREIAPVLKKGRLEGEEEGDVTLSSRANLQTPNLPLNNNNHTKKKVKMNTWTPLPPSIATAKEEVLKKDHKRGRSPFKRKEGGVERRKDTEQQQETNAAIELKKKEGGRERKREGRGRRRRKHQTRCKKNRRKETPNERKEDGAGTGSVS